jgi:PAS domain-containing protein
VAEAVGAASVEDALERGVGFDQGADAAAAEAAGVGARRETVRWIAVAGQRRAFRRGAEPLAAAAPPAGRWTSRRRRKAATTLKRTWRRHDETLNHLADAVAIFDSAKRLSFHNTAFAELWGWSPPGWRSGPATPRCWTACASAGACRRRSTTASGAPRAGLLRDPGRTARRAVEPPGRAHAARGAPAPPLGGLLLLFADITGEVRLKAQYNA